MEGLLKALNLNTGSWLLLLCLSIAPGAANAHLLIFSDQGEAYTQLLNAIEQELPARPEIAHLQQDSLSREVSLDRDVVAVGTRACEFMIRNATSTTRLLCALLPSQAFAVLKMTHQNSDLFQQGRITALFMDQPFSRQMALARIIKPDSTRIGTVFGPSSRVLEADFISTAVSLGLSPVYTQMSESDNPVRALTPVIADSDVFIAVPDSSVFNRAAARWILYISLRNRVPLIGFSTSYVDAGAVLGLYSTPAHIGRETAEMMRLMSSEAALPPARYPSYYTLSINRTAARTLRLDLPSQSEIQEAVRASEQNHDRPTH